MGTRYEARGFMKHAEQDTFENGCDPDTAQGFYSDTPIFSGDTPQAVVAEIATFLGVDAGGDAVSLDSCDEPGRVDIQLMERDDGCEATPVDLEAWKAGNLRLWLVDYSFRVERVTRDAVPLAVQP